MNPTVSLEWLLDYADHERDKWKTWLAADTSRLQLAYQPGGRFPTVASLLEHVFFVQRRHLCRLQGVPPPDKSGIPEGSLEALFAYAADAQADLRNYLATMTEDAAASEVILGGLQAFPGKYVLTRGALATHIVLHEVRHLAQLAHVARLAGLEPPGEHDLLFFAAARGR